MKRDKKQVNPGILRKGLEAVLSCIGLLILLTGCSDHEKAVLPTIQRGHFEASLVETGELQAVRARAIIMPYIGGMYGWQFKITGLIEHGSEVRAGDSIMQVDPSNVMKYLLEQQNRLETEEANMNKLIVEQKSRAEALEASLQESLADYNLKKLETERFEFESQRLKEIKELEFRQTGIRLDRIRRAIELDKKVAGNILKIQKIRVNRIKNNINDAHEAMKNLTLRSPIDGVFQVSRSWQTRQLFKVGDEIYQNSKIASVPDLRNMLVNATVNETDIGKVRVGQRVVVRLEAFPEKAFEGRIMEVGRLSYQKQPESMVRVFDLVILIDGTDPILKPGMTVSCEIYYADLEDAWYVANDCLEKEGGKYYIFVMEKKRWARKEVGIGPRNNHHTVIYGNFTKGTEVMRPRNPDLAATDRPAGHQ